MGFYYFLISDVFLLYTSVYLDSALKFPQEPNRKESASHPSLPDRESVTGSERAHLDALNEKSTIKNGADMDENGGNQWHKKCHF